MDPHNRQLCWQLMQQAKTKSTVLFTTHSMEEADLLGDQLGIMAKGKLQASGTSLELKQKHGDGYGLNCVKLVAETPVGPILDCVTAHVPAARVRTSIGSEVQTLPFFALPLPFCQIPAPSRANKKSFRGGAPMQHSALRRNPEPLNGHLIPLDYDA